MKLEDIKDLADKQYDEADWSTTFSDWAKEIPEYISIDYSYFKEAYTTAYKLGFEEGYQAAKGIPTDEFGNFIREE